jgi:hypothetical protein
MTDEQSPGVTDCISIGDGLRKMKAELAADIISAIERFEIGTGVTVQSVTVDTQIVTTPRALSPTAAVTRPVTINLQL